MSVVDIIVRHRHDQPDHIPRNSQVLPLYSQGGKGEPVANNARPSVQVLASASSRRIGQQVALESRLRQSRAHQGHTQQEQWGWTTGTTGVHVSEIDSKGF